MLSCVAVTWTSSTTWAGLSTWATEVKLIWFVEVLELVGTCE